MRNRANSSSEIDRSHLVVLPSRQFAQTDGCATGRSLVRAAFQTGMYWTSVCLKPLIIAGSAQPGFSLFPTAFSDGNK